MNSIPETKDALVLRTDFSDDVAWKSVSAAIRAPVGIFQANVDFLSHIEYDGISVAQLLSLVPSGYPHSFIFIADRLALSQLDHPILVVDLYTEPGRTFRVIPSEAGSIENNLSIANMDFAEFADAVDADGVFRGFRM